MIQVHYKLSIVQAIFTKEQKQPKRIETLHAMRFSLARARLAGRRHRRGVIDGQARASKPSEAVSAVVCPDRYMFPAHGRHNPPLL